MTAYPPAPSDATLALYGGWVRRVAMLLKLRMPWAEFDELLQWGAIGMMEAMNCFDESQGITFQAFAKKRMKWAMLNGLRREGYLRRGQVLFDADDVDAAAFSNGTTPEDPLFNLLASDSHHALALALKDLPEIEYRVIAMHFYDEMNNREIAAILDISEGQATKIRKRALGRLARHLSSQVSGVHA
jgi:RNA polymerase sigma factor (sigma-70 family)